MNNKEIIIFEVVKRNVRPAGQATPGLSYTTMDVHEISNIRLASQQITEKKFKSAKALVAWMGAMQAQDYNMAKWAIGVRLPDATVQAIDSALDRGEIIRTHVLRPTWHFISADDICWMIALTAPRVKARMRSRDKELALTESVYSRSNTIIENALSGGHRTREELMSAFKDAKIATEGNRGSHLLLRAELDGIICSGERKDSKQTYALLCERVPGAKTLHREEALAKLAHTYFSSHCPATLQDFVWWSGLTLTDARHALEMVKEHFISEGSDGKTYWLPPAFSPDKSSKERVYALPAFDEFIISYKDRSASVTLKNHKRAISNNGIFWPVIIINGQVAGVWKRTIKKDKVLIATEFFLSPKNTTKDLVEKSAEAFGRFLNKAVTVSHRVIPEA